jgi:hypothetical protein
MNKPKNSTARRAAIKPGLAIVALLTMTTIANACPMCKDSCPVNSGTPTGKVSTPNEAGFSFNTSIYFMLGGLASALGLTGRVMYKAAAFRH